jgi:Xaa-Pro aminopeptidase
MCPAGHWLGLDTHDSASVSYDTRLEPGVVLTIEPGLYVPNEERFGAYAGLGVRIEDDVAVGVGGPEVLSAGVPVDADDVEHLAGLRS